MENKHTEGQLTKFIKQHRHRLKTFAYNAKGLLSGSFSEIPSVYFFMKHTDLDFMLYTPNVCAVPKDAQFSSNFNGEILTIEPQDLLPGYVTLKNSKKEFYKHLEKYDYDNPNGPALQTPAGWSDLTFDKVFSVQCLYWPPEAQEWQTRDRAHGWPSKDLIDQIVSEGCFLVGKSHPRYKDVDDTQWRYSFSKAEIRLISSWTDSQMYIYHVLRMIKSEIVNKGDAKKKTGLCTYHLKTQMFWACEQKPAEFWEDSDPLRCIYELLKEIEQHLIDKKFPNYFLRDCNIAEGISIENKLSEVLAMLSNDFSRTLIKATGVLPPKVCHDCILSVSLPAKLAEVYYQLAQKFGTPFQAKRLKLRKDNIIKQFIDEGMNDLMDGIYNMQLGRTLGDSSYYEIAEHLWKGIPCSGTESDNVEVKRTALVNRTSLNAIAATYESMENAELSAVEEGQNQWDVYVTINCTRDRCPYAGKSFHLPWKEDEYGKFYDKWMNPTHLLSTAYLSNLYFITGKHDVGFKLVNEEHLLASDAFLSELFPMIFTPELASLFDENLQEVLGFLWLFKHLMGGKRIFEFCTCPHLFLLYIRIQASLRLHDAALEGYKYEFNRHRGNCKYRFYLYSYHYVLFEAAWRNNERQRKSE